MIHQMCLVCLCLLTIFMFFGNAGAKVPAVIVFGDSTVDPGNNNYIKTLAKSNFQPYGRDFPGGKPTGRFSNGRLVTDFISEAFGIKQTIPAYLDPAYGIQDFATGVSFASAATGYDNLTSHVLVRVHGKCNKIINMMMNPSCGIDWLICPVYRWRYCPIAQLPIDLMISPTYMVGYTKEERENDLYFSIVAKTVMEHLLSFLPCHTFPHSVIPMWKELEYYKEYQKKLFNFMGKNNAKNMLREALYLISLGTNDFIENYYINPAGRRAQFTVEEYSNYLIGISENFIRELYNLGARKISLGGLPPIGCLPILRSINIKGGGACRADCNKLARDFDGKSMALAAKLNKELTGINVIFLNVYNPALEVINNPQAYGFESVAVACCGTGTIELSYLCNRDNPFTCMDANKYVFWDAVHPTEKLYHIVADHLLKTTLAELL